MNSPTEEKATIENIENAHDEKASVDALELTARFADSEAHQETPAQSVRKHPWVLLWCAYATWVVLCGAFDSAAGGNVLGIPKFREDYGYLFEGQWTLYANWQSAFNGAPAAASIFGTFASGWISDRIGRKYAILISFCLLFIGITVETISKNTKSRNAVFFVGKLINGYAIGGSLTNSITYVGEISPLPLRGICLSAAAISFTIGSLIIALIINAYGNLESSWAYRSAFVAQYGVTGIALAIWPFMPESPSWLVSVGKDDRASNSLRKLGYAEDERVKMVAAYKLTLEESRAQSAGVTYAECFRKTNLRRTIIAIMPLSIQSFCGVFWIAGYATYYMQLAGFSTSESYKLTIVMNALSALGNITSWFLIERIGRRALTLYGMIILTILLCLTGGLACINTLNANKAVVALIEIYCYLYNVTIGATAYVAMSEIGTTRLRGKTAAISLIVQGAFSCMWSFVLPYIFNPNEANLGAKTAFVFGGLSVLCCVYVWSYHPETKGRSFIELDEMFAKGISARKFGSYVTDAELKAEEAKEAVETGEAHL